MEVDGAKRGFVAWPDWAVTTWLVHLGINKYIVMQQEPCLCKST
jgi:hypothetical protein